MNTASRLLLIPMLALSCLTAYAEDENFYPWPDAGFYVRLHPLGEATFNTCMRLYGNGDFETGSGLFGTWTGWHAVPCAFTTWHAWGFSEFGERANQPEGQMPPTQEGFRLYGIQIFNFVCAFGRNFDQGGPFHVIGRKNDAMCLITP